MAPEANHTEIVTRVLAANNHYEVLGVDRLASVAEIDRARKRLQFALHPDKNKTPDAEEAFKKVSAAGESSSIT